MFTEAERAYIGTAAARGQVPLARMATSTKDGRPHVVPLRAHLDEAGTVVLAIGHEMARSYKYQQVQSNPWVAIVWDGRSTDVPGEIQGIEVRGTAAVAHAPGDRDPHLVITPTKVFSWGINEPAAESFAAKTRLDVSHLRPSGGAG